jgi:hypothetical protein
MNMPLRLPRIPTAKLAGKVTRDIWQSPEFSVRPIDGTTEFVNTLPFLIPEKVRELEPATFKMLFSSQRVDMKQHLEAAYSVAKYKGKPVCQLIPNALRKVIEVAMTEIFMKAKKSPDPYAKYLKGGRKAFAEEARARRVPQEALRNERAKRLARRSEKLTGPVIELREFVKAYPNRTNEAKLKLAVEKKFPTRWAKLVTRGKALQNLPAIAGYVRRAETLGALDWTARQLRIGIITCEESGVRPKLGADTILGIYIPLGRKLLGLSKSRPPKQR